MNYTTLKKQVKRALLWIYKRISSKFTNTYGKLQKWFPAMNKYPILKYSLIPLLLALFLGLRYLLKIGVNEIATWSSAYVGEVSGVTISAKTIMVAVAATVVMLRLGLRLRDQQKKKSNTIALNYENKQ